MEQEKITQDHPSPQGEENADGTKHIPGLADDDRETGSELGEPNQQEPWRPEDGEPIGQKEDGPALA